MKQVPCDVCGVDSPHHGRLLCWWRYRGSLRRFPADAWRIDTRQGEPWDDVSPWWYVRNAGRTYNATAICLAYHAHLAASPKIRVFETEEVFRMKAAAYRAAAEVYARACAEECKK